MAEIGIFVGTMYGNSLLVAEEAEAILTAQGHKATVFEDPELSARAEERRLGKACRSRCARSR